MLSTVHGQTEGVQYLSRVVQGAMKTPLLLVGPEGTGRRFSVIAAAKEAFREDEPERCSQCFKIDRGIHPDFRIVQPPSGKEIKVETIRDLISTTGFRPAQAPYKYLVIDGADRMTSAAANALLKTLEEAPSEVRFFLLAEDETKVLPTIRSRCALVRFQPLSEEFILQTLQQHTDDSTKALVYCRLAEGSVGRAVKFLGSGRLMLRDQMLTLFKIAATGNIQQLFSAIDSVDEDLLQGLRFGEHILHDLTMINVLPSRVTNLDVMSDLKTLYAKIGPQKVATLRTGLLDVWRAAQGHINLPFHVKTWLTTSFV